MPAMAAATHDQFVVIRLKNQLYGISTLDVCELIRMVPVCRIPRTVDYVRGMINIRGRVVPLIDLRLRMGQLSCAQEINELLTLMQVQQRKQDHINWLKELESSVEEGREFKLAVDPHKCAFGKWYDHFKTDNVALNMILGDFDEPHRQIHGIAHQVEEFKKANKLEEAKSLIMLTRDTDLRFMVKLFDNFQTRLKKVSQEIVVVLQTLQNTFAISVDAVDSVDSFESGFEPLPADISREGKEWFQGIARRQKDGQFVWILNVDKLMDDMRHTLPVGAEG